ncbi:MAG TPA: arsenate reductase ArsC [bacterium]|nr:arsenate reductase ArsC [bacterium]
MPKGTNTPEKPVVLIVCTGNSCRSQIAEGLISNAFGSAVRVYSAGSNPSGVVHPMAIDVMREIGVIIRRNKSQHWRDLPVDDFDLIVTVCDHADRHCPLVPTAHGERMHIPFDDPIRVTGSSETVRQAFRETREQIREILLPAIREWVDHWYE